MTDRDVQAAQAQEAALRSYVQDTAGSGAGTADELSSSPPWQAQVVITDAEFAQQKAKLLA
jgi:hypothetical protein